LSATSSGEIPSATARMTATPDLLGGQIEAFDVMFRSPEWIVSRYQPWLGGGGIYRNPQPSALKEKNFVVFDASQRRHRAVMVMLKWFDPGNVRSIRSFLETGQDCFAGS
jgi:hypothetical protein